MVEQPRAATLRHAIEIFISPSDDNIANLDQLLTDDATVWTPNMLANRSVGSSGKPCLPRIGLFGCRHPVRYFGRVRQPWTCRIPCGRALLGTLRH